MVRMQILTVFTRDQCYMAICILECREKPVMRDEGCESGSYRTRGTQSCRVNHDPHPTFLREDTSAGI